MRKLLILGLDGASPELIDRFAKDGILPNLQSMIERGSFTKLKSVIPTISSTAWSSFATGVNPGKHNIFGFLKQVNGKDQILSSWDRKAPAIWSYLSQAGKKVAVVNMPLTFPVDKINGVMVSGMLTPSLRSNFVHPSEFRAELFEEVPGYEIDITETLWAGNKRKYLEKVLELTRKKRDLSLHLLAKQEWDAFFLIITELDRLQHFFWSPGLTEYKDVVRDYYVLLDEILGQVMNKAGPQSDLLVVSDHGFGTLEKCVHVNTVLRDAGLLIPQIDRRSVVPGGIRTIKGVANVLMKVGVDLERVKNFLPDRLVSSLTVSMSEVGADMSKSKAYFSSGLGEGIFIVDKAASNYHALREEIIERLLKMRDPENGMQVFQDVVKRDDLYSGDFVSNAADLVVVLREGYSSVANLSGVGQWLSKPGKNEINGDHRIDGVFLACGPSFNSFESMRSLSILDMAPLLLHYFGLSIPGNLDGTVPTELFQPPLNHPPRITSEFEGSPKKPAPEQLSKEDESIIMDQLKSLGYV